MSATVILAAFFSIASIFSASAQIIETIAGGYIGDDQPATSVHLPEIGCVEMGRDGILYFCDRINYRVRKIDPDNTLSTFAGSDCCTGGDDGPATEGRFHDPVSIAFDSQGNVFIADKLANVIRKINATTNIITTYAGTGKTGQTGDGDLAIDAAIGSPEYIAVDNNDDLYISATTSHRIRKIDVSTGIITTVVGTGSIVWEGDSGPAVNASTRLPRGLAFDQNNNLYFTDFHRIRKVDAISQIITTIGGTGVNKISPDGTMVANATFGDLNELAVAPDGTIYYAESAWIRKIHPVTSVITSVGGGGNYYAVEGMKMGNDAYIYFLSGALGIDGVYRLDPLTSIITRIAGGPYASGDGGPAAEANLKEPTDVIVDKKGNIYIAENFGIRVIDAITNTISTIVDSRSYKQYFGLALDSKGNLYFLNDGITKYEL